MRSIDLEKLEESALMSATEDSMERSILTEMLSESEHVQGLIQQSAAAVISASAGMQHTFESSEPLPRGSQVLDHHAAATRHLHEAVERLTLLDQMLQGEIKERALIDHQLAAAFEQEEGSRKAALRDQLTGSRTACSFMIDWNMGSPRRLGMGGCLRCCSWI
jgi:hypothetical protein